MKAHMCFIKFYFSMHAIMLLQYNDVGIAKDTFLIVHINITLDAFPMCFSKVSLLFYNNNLFC